MFIGPDLLLDLEGLLFIYGSDPDGIGAVFQRTILSGDHRPDKASSATDGKWHASVTDLSVGIDFDQRPNQTQQRFMLGMSLTSAQKFTDVDLSHMTARLGVRFVPDEDVSRGGIAGEKPPIAVRAAVKLSFLHRHQLALGERTAPALS